MLESWRVTLADLEQAERIVALKQAEHLPLLHERFPAWVEKIEFWHVDDAPDALPLIEREIMSLVAHMLSQVGFPGAAAAVLVHASPVLGLLTFCGAAAAGIGLAGRRLGAGSRAESAAVGSILAFSLGLGLLFFRLYADLPKEMIFQRELMISRIAPR